MPRFLRVHDDYSPPEVLDVDDDTFAAWCRLYETRPVEEFNAASHTWAELIVLREDGTADAPLD